MLLARTIVVLLAVGWASAARKPVIEPSVLAIQAAPLYSAKAIDDGKVGSVLRASAALPVELR